MQLYQPTITGSLAVSGSVSVSGSITIAGGGSIAGTASIATTALTASSADNFLTRGTLTAQTIVVQTITSSIDFVTGSTKFGSINSNTHQFTGSVSISGSSTFGLAVNNNALYVSSSGQVGINTTTPNFGLDVSGTGRFTGTLSGTSATFSGNVTVNAEELTINKAGGSFLTLKTTNTTDTQYIQFSDNDGAAGAIFYNHTNNSLTAKVNGTNQLTISSTGAATFSSSVQTTGLLVGISSNAGYLARIYGGNGSQLLLDTTSQYCGIDIANSGTVKGGLSWDNTNAFFGLYTNSGIPMTFQTANTERMRITSGGDVLIARTGSLATGTSTSRFVVGGAVNVGSAVNNTSFPTKDDGGLGVYVGSGANAFQVWDDNQFSYPRFIVQRAGNVGVGAASPSEKLHISGSAVIRMDGGTGVTPFAIANNNSTGFRIYDYTAALDRMVITSGGNVLIAGTSTNGSPIFQIDKSDATTNSSAYFWNTYTSGMMIRNSSTTTNTLAPIYFYMGSSNNSIAGIAGIQESSTLGAIGFFTGGSGVSNTVPERMRITSGGTLQMSTTTISNNNAVFGTSVNGGYKYFSGDLANGEKFGSQGGTYIQGFYFISWVSASGRGYAIFATVSPAANAGTVLVSSGGWATVSATYNAASAISLAFDGSTRGPVLSNNTGVTTTFYAYVFGGS